MEWDCGLQKNDHKKHYNSNKLQKFRDISYRIPSTMSYQLSPSNIQYLLTSNRQPAYTTQTSDLKFEISISIQVLSEKFHGYPNDMTLN